MAELSALASQWLDRFFAAYYRTRPVNATLIGIHDYDAVLPDFSEHGVGDAVATMEALLADSAAIDTATLTPIEQLDLRVALGFLTTQLWEYRSFHGHRGNPSLYLSEAIFGAMSLLLTDFAPYQERLGCLEARLTAVPTLLDQAIANVRSAPLPWIERAFRECRGAMRFIGEGIPTLPDRPARLDAAAARAGAAFEAYRNHLRDNLAPNGTGRIAAGEEPFALHLRECHFVDRPAAEIARWAEEELTNVEARLRERHPAPAATPGGSPRYQEIWAEARDRAIEAGLLSWPDFPIRYRPRPAWATAAAPDLYFLYYRAPAAFNRPPVHEYLVPDEPPDETSVRLNHVVHHGGLGHHVQNWHAYRSPSRVGRVAAVDCASRIAMLAGGTMAEGWACYATDLMNEIGYLNSAEQLDELRTRRRMCARAIVDVELHVGRFTFERAVRFYRERGGMSGEQASAEATKNSMFPGGAVMYLLGQDGIHQLRGELSARLGSTFQLAQFHERLLSFGSLPVSLVASQMRRESLGATVRQ